ncbi:WxL domain-containing protein [Enterococcus sp. AZ109]|uniref:WxL domain-containing protein n=1 Tax=Enterococcus sp. AZ109 TaxID=2774634 RepID=UPI003F28F04A
MKKILAMLTLSGIALSAWGGFAATASAAEVVPGSGPVAADSQTADKTSVAEFTIEKGDLTLDKVSDLHFSNADGNKNPTVADFVNEQNLTLDGSPVSANTNKADNNDDEVIVSDFRGSHDGWNLSVQKTDFTNGKDDIDGDTLTLSAKTSDTNGNAVASAGLPKDVVINKEATPFIDAAKDTGTFTNTFALDGNLKIPANSKIQAGTYQSTVTWTLSATAKTQPAS